MGVELRAHGNVGVAYHADFTAATIVLSHYAYINHSSGEQLIATSGHNYSSPQFIGGTITLQDIFNVAQTLFGIFRPIGGYALLYPEVFTREITLNPDGSFNLDTVPPGTYEVSVKGAKWLRKNVMLDNSTGPVTTFALDLLAGDANDDNSVDVFDLALLIQAFNSVPGDPNWNEACDFNCDSSVDIFDLDLLIRNFNTEGDL